ncbi:MAG TPA: hypothetical protein VFV50_00410, partial [Bdellovibrionales bacterium]|nr:hypothetical protein [Bdellovibrionales bacterium]
IEGKILAPVKRGLVKNVVAPVDSSARELVLKKTLEDLQRSLQAEISAEEIPAVRRALFHRIQQYVEKSVLGTAKGYVNVRSLMSSPAFKQMWPQWINGLAMSAWGAIKFLTLDEILKNMAKDFYGAQGLWESVREPLKSFDSSRALHPKIVEYVTGTARLTGPNAVYWDRSDIYDDIVKNLKEYHTRWDQYREKVVLHHLEMVFLGWQGKFHKLEMDFYARTQRLAWMARSCPIEWFPQGEPTKECDQACQKKKSEEQKHACISEMRLGKGRAVEDRSFKKNGGKDAMPWHVDIQFPMSFTKEFDELYQNPKYKKALDLPTKEARYARLQEILGVVLPEEEPESQDSAAQTVALSHDKRERQKQQTTAIAAQQKQELNSDERRALALRPYTGDDGKTYRTERHELNEEELYLLGKLRAELEPIVDKSFYKQQEPFAAKLAYPYNWVSKRESGYHPFNLWSSYDVEFEELRKVYNQIFSKIGRAGVLEQRITEILKDGNLGVRTEAHKAKDPALSAACSESLMCHGITNFVSATIPFYIKINWGNGFNRVMLNLKDPKVKAEVQACTEKIPMWSHHYGMDRETLAYRVREAGQNVQKREALQKELDDKSMALAKRIAICQSKPLEPLSPEMRIDMLAYAFAKQFYKIVMDRESIHDRRKLILTEFPQVPQNRPVDVPDADHAVERASPRMRTDPRQLDPNTGIPGPGTQYQKTESDLRELRKNKAATPPAAPSATLTPPALPPGPDSAAQKYRQGVEAARKRRQQQLQQQQQLREQNQPKQQQKQK